MSTINLGHYSTRYENIKLFKEEAQTIFRSVLADDGKSFDFIFKIKTI
jgi:ribonuclease Z